MAQGYKFVIRDHTGTLRSPVMSYDPEVVYRVNEAVTPGKGHGPLCVLDTIEHARRYAEREYIYDPASPAFRLYLCEYEPSPEPRPWTYEDGKKLLFYGDTLPTGTVLASSVTLLKEVAR